MNNRMKQLLVLLAFVSPASAQLKVFGPNDVVSYLDVNGNFSWLQANKAPLSHVHLISDIATLQSVLDGKQPALGFTPEDTARRNQPNGYLGIESDGSVKIPTLSLGPKTIAAGVNQLPAAAPGNVGWATVIVDAASASDCTVGGGTAAALCRSDGSAWVALGGGSGSGAISTLGASLSSPTVLTIGSGCSTSAPCNVRFGNAVWSIQRSATATIDSGSGIAFIWVDQTGSVTVGHNLSVSCSTGCRAQSGITSFPTGAIPIGAWTATNGTWDAQGGSDYRSWLSTNVLNPGQGIVIVDAGGMTTVSVDSTIPHNIASGTTALGTSSIASGTCAAPVTAAATGTTVADVVTASFNGNPTGVVGYIPTTNGMLAIIAYPTADAANFAVCNNTAAAITPGAVSVNWKVVR